MADLCFRCMRPKASCYCKYIKPVDTKVKFVFLMHPKEAKQQRTGTGRLASLSLPGSEILMGVDFTENQRLNELLADPSYYPVMLYPDPDAWTSKKDGFSQAIHGKTLLVFIVDATWACAKKMVKLSQNLKTVPKFSFTGNYKSIFTFKREPKEYCVSTIESCYYLIKELQETGIENKTVNPEPLLDVFKRMILFQIQKENERIASGTGGSHAYDWKYTKQRELPSL